MDWRVLYIAGMILAAMELRREFGTYKKYSSCWWLCEICILLWPILAGLYAIAWVTYRIRGEL